MISHLSLGLNSHRLITSSTPHTPWHRLSAALGKGLELCREPQGARSAVCAVTGHQADWSGDCHCHFPQPCKWASLLSSPSFLFGEGWGVRGGLEEGQDAKR